MAKIPSYLEWPSVHLRSILSRSLDLALLTDASGTLGYGIYYSGHWIADTWPPPLQGRSIQWKERYLIALACFLWGHSLLGKKILFLCDNQAVFDIWAFGTSRDPDIMHLVCSIFSVVLLTISQS